MTDDEIESRIIESLGRAKGACSTAAMLTEDCGYTPIGRARRYSATGNRVYIAVGRILQRLKRQGRVEYVGRTAGWRLA